MAMLNEVIDLVKSGEVDAEDSAVWFMRELVVDRARIDQLPKNLIAAIKAAVDWYLDNGGWLEISNSGVENMAPIANEICRKIGYRTRDMPKPAHERDRIPLISGAGRSRELSDYRHRWLVLYFYPKDNTPGCTLEGINFNAHLDDFRAAGAEVVGVSRDSAKSHAGFCAKHGFRFDLLSDPDDALGNAFGVIGEKSLYGRKFIGVVRSTFLLDPEGHVVAEWRGVKVAGHAETVLAELRRQQAGGAPMPAKAAAKKAVATKAVVRKAAVKKSVAKTPAPAKKAPAKKSVPARKSAAKKAARRK